MNTEEQSPVKRALSEIRSLRSRLEAAERTANEPVAIVGVGLRFPGGCHEEWSFWRLLCEGRSGVTEVPSRRWDIGRIYHPNPETPGKTPIRHGAFLEEIDGFDADFFSITPKEAVAMDPQQRLLLEVSWEAIENAGIPAADLQGTATGVFFGLGHTDYQRLLLSDPRTINGYTGVGGSAAVASGRVSYFLGLRGPSLTIDTACSGSLVAVHLACNSLRSGECNMALAGGVNLMLGPEGSIVLSRAGMLSPDGCCKTFDKSANGFVRGEGCGVVVLKRLRDAVADRDRILAVIRGSATNQDGRSAGLTAPNGPSQQELVRLALTNAGVDPASVDYIEAHGTGTELGDAVEAHALTAVFQDRAAPLVVGSVKTNIGHLEAAAGIAGLIKTALMLDRKWIPPHLHFRELNPKIDWNGMPVVIPAEGMEWPHAVYPRRAGVSSFGFSGTNVHVVLESAPENCAGAESAERPVLFLSARTDRALREYAGRTADFLKEAPHTLLGDLCYSSSRRTRFPFVATFEEPDIDSLRDQLSRFSLAEQSRAGAGKNRMPTEGGRIAFPGYPFQRKRYYIQSPAAGPLSFEAGRAAVTSAKKTAAVHLESMDTAAWTKRWQVLDELAAVCQIHGLRRHDGFRAAQGCTIPDLIESGNILPTHAVLIRRWLSALAGRGWVRREGDTFRDADLAIPEIDDVLRRAIATPGVEPRTAEWIAACGRMAPDVVSGRRSALDVIFSPEDETLPNWLYRESDVSVFTNRVLASAVEAYVRASPGDTSIRVLEIGAGTGGATSAILPVLPRSGVDYLFTDVSADFLNRARTEFAEYSFLRFGLLDIERDPREQIGSEAAFDLVVASNVLHATRDIRLSLRNICSVLAPSGLLILGEATRDMGWHQVTTALLDGWRRFADDLRTDHPLLSAQRWEALLATTGFEDVAIFPEPADPRSIVGQHVIVGRAPAARGRTEVPDLTRMAEDSWLSEILTVASYGRHAIFCRVVQREVARVAGCDPADLTDLERPLAEIGLDSLMMLELRDCLGKVIGPNRAISATAGFDYPTISRLADYLEKEVFGFAERVPGPTSGPPASPHDSLAVIGIGCRFPGGVDNPDAFWDLLANGVDAVGSVPQGRFGFDDWSMEEQGGDDRLLYRHGGFLRDSLLNFDTGFFGISPREAEWMDPQQRLLLEVSWEAFASAGYTRENLQGSRTGVFVGIASDDWMQLLNRRGVSAPAGLHGVAGLARSVASGRISYVYGLAGPSISIDTACSSSLVAVHEACRSLRAGECRMAVAGGVNLMLAPETTIALAGAQMLAPDAKCKAFDDGADGFVRGEGCGMVVLKRLPDAIDDGDPIRAVIRGTSVNQDGRTSGLTAPNGPAQETLIRDALADAGLSPEDVAYVEAHGTGTPLGDPIEMNALARVLGNGRTPAHPLLVGSVKTNFGHLEAAAGVAGLIKTVLMVEKGQIPPHLHYRKLNRHIQLGGASIDLPDRLVPWCGEESRTAAVSSFGFSGTNAHVIVQSSSGNPYTSAPVAGFAWNRLELRMPIPVEKRSAKEHPLLGRRLRSPALKQNVFESRLRSCDPPFLADHRIAGEILLPMACFIVIAAAAAPDGAIETLRLEQPLKLQDSESSTIQVISDEDTLEVFGLGDGNWTRLLTARLTKGGPPELGAARDLQAIRGRMENRLDPASVYRRLDACGLRLGPSFQTMEEVRTSRTEALARVRLRQGHGSLYPVHPLIIDGCIQALAGLRQGEERIYLPVGVDRLRFAPTIGTEVWCHVTERLFDDVRWVADLEILDNDGRVVGIIEGLQLQRSTSGSAHDDLLYTTEWQSAPLSAGMARHPGAWVLLSDTTARLLELGSYIEGRGIPGRTAATAELDAGAIDDSDVGGIVYVGCSDPGDSATEQAVEASCAGMLRLVGRMIAKDSRTPVCVVTQGANYVEDGDWQGVDQAALAGLTRTVQTEHAALPCRLVDLDPKLPFENQLDNLILELATGSEPEVVWRGGNRHVPRLRRQTAPRIWKIESGHKYGKTMVRMAAAERRKPEANEAEVRVDFAALNFHDVLSSLGEYPGETAPLGSECTGRITRLGSEVTELRIGDAVVALGTGCLAQYVTLPADMIAPIPANLTPEQAVTLPVAFVTARYALEKARLRAGERVLIHSAAGGVGHAAVQIARAMGALVFATAGSDEKRKHVLSLGALHAMDSRTSSFAGETRAVTGGAGVDVVLNTLGSTDLVEASLLALAPGGRFVELGTRLALTREDILARRPDIEYLLIDLSAPTEAQRTREIFHQVMKQAVAGEVRPIPVSAFRSGRAEHAFRFMAEGRHTGKIVIRGNMEIGLRSDRTYLIAGGVGGLGLKLAQWMADRGARNIVLVSRGAPRHEALQEIRAIRGTGALVLTRNADIADWDQATGVFDEIRASMPPLAGVVQAAGVLRRAVVEQLDWATFWTVLRPKALGTRNLDRLTRDSPLDFFVAFSSFASWIGAPGQANHAAASCCVDAIVHRRRMLGLPGVTINWGPWAQVGAASLGDDLLPGGTPLIPKVALSAFERALETTEPQVSILDADWAQVVRRFPATVSFLSEVLGSNEGAVPVPFSVLSSDILAAMQPESRRAAIRAQVADVARCVLGLPEDAPLSFQRPLSDMGMDSLMSIEFRDRMERALDLKLESTVLYSYPSLEELLRFLEPNWRGLLPLETNAPSPSRLDGLLHAVEVMSDKRAVSILKQRAGSV